MSLPSLEKAHVAVIGLGLMGGSLALALRDQCQRITGVDRDEHTRLFAQSRHFVDRVTSRVSEAVEEADLIVLAVPVGEIIRILGQLGGVLRETQMIMDLGSTKTEVCKVMGSLPVRSNAIGGHPMCGKETLGIQHADAEIFVEAPFALTPLADTSRETRELAEEVVKTIGARPIWLEPETHDAWVAATSHLPFLISLAQAFGTPHEAAAMIGPGFRSSARLAATPSSMMWDVLKTNRGNILAALERFKAPLGQLEQALISGNDGDLLNLLEKGAASYGVLLTKNWSAS
jgi:prephenate dehydrogenase